MSHQKGRLVSEILNRYFGDIVQKVGDDLFTFGSKPISLIIKTTRLHRLQVIESLRALLKYDLASFEPSHIETIPNYKLNSDNVILLLRYLLQIKTKFGSEAELIVEELLQNGSARATQLLLNIANKYKDDKDKNINIIMLKDTFISLVTAGYIQQAPIADSKENTEVPTLVPVVTIVPEFDSRALLQALATGDDSALNDKIYWKVHFDRFHQDFRDDLMVKAIIKCIDENAGELMRHLLTHMYLYSPPWAPTSNPVPIQDLKAAMERSPDRPLLKNHLEQYLKVMG
ncbi:DNA-directed RNA polymerase III subunit RPC3 [Eumeta japonica]|uniref:DNA-directed RNA polymerase III subunit RPC3 n=1 Tax=Eumeta variegata TaxID=151549 RepID=A0A4C1XJC2_EUMVA|nr:DNA-directed RNA polymerase III subunit RPC3 [Eumeta japonica]